MTFILFYFLFAFFGYQVYYLQQPKNVNEKYIDASKKLVEATAFLWIYFVGMPFWFIHELSKKSYNNIKGKS